MQRQVQHSITQCLVCLRNIANKTTKHDQKNHTTAPAWMNLAQRNHRKKAKTRNEHSKLRVNVFGAERKIVWTVNSRPASRKHLIHFTANKLNLVQVFKKHFSKDHWKWKLMHDAWAKLVLNVISTLAKCKTFFAS